MENLDNFDQIVQKELENTPTDDNARKERIFLNQQLLEIKGLIGGGAKQTTMLQVFLGHQKMAFKFSQRFLIAWLILLVLVLAVQFSQCIKINGTTYNFDDLSDTVLVAIFTTATANFIGIYVIIVRHLFPDGIHEHLYKEALKNSGSN